VLNIISKKNWDQPSFKPTSIFKGKKILGTMKKVDHELTWLNHGKSIFSPTLESSLKLMGIGEFFTCTTLQIVDTQNNLESIMIN
jgi:hypothetical protein